MKGDFTRWSFDPAKHYHSVLKQQGRVDLDADWNEQGAITTHRVETEALDVIGRCGAPVGNAGFALAPGSNGSKLTISKGRAYVDGILCVNEQDQTPLDKQPDFPGFQWPKIAGVYLAYLEVWLRHIISLDDNHILEEALNGRDTCTRAKTVWQVNLLFAGKLGSDLNCASSVGAWNDLTSPSTGTLQARAQPDPTKTGPCTIPAKAGYRSLENQLYRVEIHDRGSLGNGGGVTFKWSRDNGSVVTAWTGTGKTPNDLTVTSVGRDSVLGFAPGQWVELTDDTHELKFQPGTLVQLKKVDGLTLTIDPATATGPTDFASFPTKPKIRRWDSAGLPSAQPGSWIDLENGVQVNFGTGSYFTGDYWLIPARTLTTNVEWPLDAFNNPVAELPRGIRRHYCRLGIVQFDGSTWSVLSSCLSLFSPISPRGIHVTDVQLIKPGGSLQNDSNVQLIGSLAIRVLCDAPVDPVSAQPTTCFVTIDQPIVVSNGASGVVGFQPLVLPGQVSVVNTPNTNAIDLTFPDNVLSFLSNLLGQPLKSRVLTHLTLKGKFIWGRDDPTLYLDGAAFGITRKDGEVAHIGLRLPRSGNGTAGSDFEMWFYLFRLTPTTTTLTSSVQAPVFGQPITFTATVLAAGTPTGNVLFMDGNVILGTVVLANGVAPPLTVSTLSAGTHTILAVYQGDARFASSTSPPLTQLVNQAATVTTLSSKPNPSRPDQQVAFEAKVTATAPGSGTPTGTVAYQGDGNSPFQGTTQVNNGVASFDQTFSTDSKIIVVVTASYSGDPNFLPSKSVAFSQTVNPVRPPPPPPGGGGHPS
jgi:hypothetical protein